jgi:hypothetical protein
MGHRSRQALLACVFFVRACFSSKLEHSPFLAHIKERLGFATSGPFATTENESLGLQKVPKYKATPTHKVLTAKRQNWRK